MAFERWNAIAKMPRHGARARHEPAAPTLSERAALIDRHDVRLLSARFGRRAEHQQTRHAERVSADMASQTPELAAECRASRGPLVERIEDDAVSFVVRGQLEQFTIAYPPECYAVVEKQR